MFRRISPHRLLIGGLIVGLALAAARMLALQGLIRPVRVVSGSMAERLLGEHFSVTCADCGFVFPFAVESPPPAERAVCPNCGYARNPVRLARRERGDRVIIDRAAYLFDSPRRFDLVAFRDPRQPVRLVVKRIVGLPGEQIAIRHGDLYVNGKLWRKSLAEFHRVALQVHDNAFAPQPQQSFPARWRPAADQTGWQADGPGFLYVPRAMANRSAKSPAPDIDWLTYHHWRCFANPYPRSAEAAVADNYGYNQGESRELREVVDLILHCRATLTGNRELALRIHDGREWFTARLNLPEQSAALLRGDFRIAATNLPSDLIIDPLEIEFGLLDRQIILAVRGREVIRLDYEPGEFLFRPIPQPVSIGGLESEITVSKIRLRRDVYYLDPWSVGQLWETVSPASHDDYFVLGDNPPVSDDSRKWLTPFLPSDSILGRVISLPR